MKTIKNFALVFFVMFGFAIQAQTGYRMGLQISPNLGFIPTSSDLKSTWKPDIGFGLTVSRYFDERYSFNTGVELPSLRTSIGNEAGDTSMSFRASFVQVPLAFKMKTISFGYWTIYARVGGSIGIKYQENAEFSQEGLTTQSNPDAQIENFLLTAMGSIGAEYDLGIESSLFMSLDFHRSLLNQVDPRNVPFLGKDRPRMSWIALNLGIIF
ncbi:MAG: outer membrane beta-barrel protein [Cryomorphaceae bacterium]|nr:outer membrane beta-barrel protein [Cryomorphaceae bacterium]